jgi:putative oxidoreductase
MSARIESASRIGTARAAGLDRVLAWRDSLVVRDAGLLTLRVGLAWIFIYHGAGTLFGAFGGPGIHRQSEFFATVAHLHPGGFFAVLNGITEFFGGIAVGLGAAGRLAAFGLAADMVIAMATVTWGNGIVSNAVGSGYELNIALVTMAVAVVLLGCGRVSVDALVGSILRTRRANAGAPAVAGA